MLVLTQKGLTFYTKGSPFYKKSSIFCDVELKCYCLYIVEFTNCKRISSLYFVRLFVKVQSFYSKRSVLCYDKEWKVIINTENRFLTISLEKSFTETERVFFFCPEGFTAFICMFMGWNLLWKRCVSYSMEYVSAHVITTVPNSLVPSTLYTITQ